MNQSEKHKFEEEWERMFESVSETPPPSVWGAIEKRLDGDTVPAIVPLVWWKNPKIAYAAAAVVALLLISWPILKLTKKGSERAPQVASHTMKADGQEEKAKPDALDGAPSLNEPLAMKERTITKEEPSVMRSESRVLENTLALSSEKPILAESSASTNEPIAIQKFPSASTGRESLVPTKSADLALTVPGSLKIDASSQTTGTLSPVTAASGTGTPGAEFAPILQKSIASLSPVGVSEVDIHVQKRYVFYRHELPEMDIMPPTKNSKEYWAGVGIMPASFNPGVSVTAPPAAFSQARASRQSLSNSSKAGLSYAVQAQTGMKLSKHWTIETGLSYLQGNSTFESDGYVLDASTNQSANVLEGALLAGAMVNKNYAFNPSVSDGLNTAALYIDLDQKTSNDYRFMQVPVQAGYVINPDGKVNYTVLGGTVANVFLRNEIESGSGSSFVNTADDGIYRSLSWSAATGVRLNYRLSDHWSANLTGSYQKSLTSGMRSGNSLESRPQLYGVAWGVRYVF